MKHPYLIASCLLGLSALAIHPDYAAAADNPQVRALLKTHCIECHGAETQEANLRLDTLAFPSTALDNAHVWSRVVNAVERGEMPPDYQEQPTADERKQLIGQIVGTVTQATERPISLRRLNRQEYENTVHDLLGIDVPLVDLLPEDGKVQGFDKGIDGLSFSSVLLEEYLKAANVAFDATIRRIEPLSPETRRAELMQIKENIDSVKKKKGGVIEVDGSLVKFTPGWPPARIDDSHPIEDGVYRCRVAIWPHNPGDRTISVALYVGALFGPDTQQFVGIFDAAGTPGEPRVVEFTCRMDEGDTIHIVPRVWPEHVTWRDKHEKRPGVGIAWVETYGPLDQSFPSEATKKLFGDVESITMKEHWSVWMRHRKNVKSHLIESSQPKEDLQRMLKAFIPRAFRRPVSDQEMQPFIDLAINRLESGRTFEQAARSGVTAVMCAPQFLLVNREPVVDDYTIASRLSYFLWSTMPDEELLKLAAEGKLSDPAVRRAQVNRMIADPRIENLVNDFTAQWLDLRDIEFTTPDKKLYPEYDPLLLEGMLGETRHFFEHVLQEDLSVMNFIDSDWTFLNQRMAGHYGLPEVEGHEQFQKVSLPEDSIRGGVLTHASVLKVTANGTTTSPVIRGVWVLDKMLGRPAPPPPPGVPAVEPDIRGATTIREQLDKHRNNAACASCHKRIDPPGFALEEFDAIGGHRDYYRSVGEGERIPNQKSYRKGPDVESSFAMADGREFENFVQFRQQMSDDQALVARAIAEKLLIYSTGRRMGLAQRDAVDQIVAQSSKHDLGLKSMIHAVVESDLFLAP
ncbi:DUF1592 domain-containing protein [Bremerella sp. JC770]|uniref:DUF1592 domain-containing protein n=1 Tax=Bremerella sp. JC770 TaxID=3232137 RepID=UPI0034578D7A